MEGQRQEDLLFMFTFMDLNKQPLMYFVFEGRRISYTDRGKGVPVVLVHGYLENAEIWNGFAEKLSEKHRVIAIDLPGHGGSGTFGSTHTMEFMARVVKELSVHLATGRFFLAGHSMGGYVTLAFAELYPELLRAYCLFHSQPFADTPEAIEKRKREIAMAAGGRTAEFYPANITRMFAASDTELSGPLLTRSLEIAGSLDADGIIAVLNGMMERPSRLHIMEQDTLPYLWILGALDNYIPCGAMQARVSVPPGSSVAILRSSGHMGFLEEEKESLEIFSAFMQDILKR